MDNWLLPPETSRLRLRHMTEDDAPNLLKMDANPVVMKYLEAPDYTLEKELYIVGKVREYYEKYSGYGAWIGELKDTGEFVGWFSLKHLLPPDKCTDIEIGYRMLPTFWNKGLASEMAINLVKFGFEHHQLSFICGVTHPEHIASQRVLEKAGMEYLKNMEFHGEDVKYFQITAEEYATLR